jgi:hypothetical protein
MAAASPTKVIADTIMVILVDGFIGALGSDIYQSTKDLMLKQITPSLPYVQTGFIIAGFGLILYDIYVFIGCLIELFKIVQLFGYLFVICLCQAR